MVGKKLFLRRPLCFPINHRQGKRRRFRLGLSFFQDQVYWPKAEEWLKQRYAKIYPANDQNVKFRVLGYQWRSLHFNSNHRQSTVKIMAASRGSYPGSVLIVQQGHLLQFHVCLFVLLKISAPIQAMGLPCFSVMAPSGGHVQSKPDPMDEVLSTRIHERLLLYESDAEKFITENANLYDLIFIDAYDGEYIFLHKLWDPHSPFLQALADQLRPENGTVVVNLHSDIDVLNIDSSQSILPVGKYVSNVCQAYSNSLLEQDSGLAFTISVPWV